jgi:2-oxoglutarate dehydrogenase E2 component (dihydrolipoamide succinyltransferase)
MSVVDLVMPKLGESIMEATILKWLKNPGDKVEQDETLLEIATDKVDSEVPSTASGILESVMYNVNDIVPIGAVIAKINTGGNGSNTSASQEPVEQNIKQDEPAGEIEEIPYQPVATQSSPQQPASSGGPRFYSPLVLKIVQEEGISLSELETIPGTGLDGRVSKKDILAWLENRHQKPSTASTATSEKPAPNVSLIETRYATQTTEKKQEENRGSNGDQQVAAYQGNVEIIELDRMRKLIAKHMVDSKHTSAHVTSFTEADVTNMVMWRDKVKSEFEKRENDKITFTPLFVEAVVKSIKKFPWLNSSIEGDKLIVKKDIHIGMATALPNGNLIVPVIKNADQLNLVGLSKKVNSLANAARNNKLSPDDIQGGTFTLTNVGTFGSLMGTPIINQPQVAILAVGAIKKRPVVIETAQGDSIAIRHMMYLSLSYDHRIIDGALGSTFLNAVAKELENWDVNRNI